MTSDRVAAVVLLIFLLWGALLVKYPMTTLRRTLTEKQWRRLELAEESSVSGIVRLIGSGFIVFVLMALLLMMKG